MKITEWLKSKRKYDRDGNEIPLTPPMTDKEAIDFLQEYLLYKNWCEVDPLSHQQINTIIVFTILKKYSKRFRKEIK